MVIAFDRPLADDLLTLTEAAAIAGVHRNTVSGWCASGRLASIRVNRRGERRLRRADLDRLVRARATTSDVSTPRRLRLVHDQLTGGDALRRITAELSGTDDLTTLLHDVLDDSAAIFAADRVGFWTYDASRDQPLDLVAHRRLPRDLIARVNALESGSPSAALEAIRSGQVVVLADAAGTAASARTRAVYEKHSVATAAFVPVVFRGEALGLLAVYHGQAYDWSEDEVALSRSFADGIATAIGNARLFRSVETLARRLRSIQDLGLRLNRITDVAGIGEAIVAEAAGLLSFDTIRVYQVDGESNVCEPIAFRGRFMGTEDPTPTMLRVPVGRGLTGWVAEHNEALLVGDTAADERSVIVSTPNGPESMLVVPMTYEDRVQGVIVVSLRGRDRFTLDDQATLTIFAGYAAQALVNAQSLAQLRLQQGELQHQLASQRRLLEVNEQLLSTLDPAAVLELIADSLKSVVAYDSLTIYRVDRERGVRRPVVARDRFAELILDYEAPLGTGITGWVVDHVEAVLANDAHLDPRSSQVPGTPFEAESLIVVPLVGNGDVIGTLNVGRMGTGGARFSQNEFELTKLFAGQASIALRNAETHGEVQVRAERDALTNLRNHGAFQRELDDLIGGPDTPPFAILMMDLDAFKVFNDSNGHPAGDALLASVARAMESAVRVGDRLYRYGGDEFAVVLPGADPAIALDVGERIKAAVHALPDPATGPRVTVSVGSACWPEDGRTKDDLVQVADQALYLAKGSRIRSGLRDPYLAALDATTIALLDGGEPDGLLEMVVERAARLLGAESAYLYLVEPDERHLVARVGLGSFRDFAGHRMDVRTGLSGLVYRTGRPAAVESYDDWADHDPSLLGRGFGAVVAVPLTSGPRVIGVLGISSGVTGRTFGEREIGALARFGQLASIALDNARLHEAARRGSLYDPVTGLANRELLDDRLTHVLARLDGAAESPPIGVILLDLDRFKVINETLGHTVGDRLLKAVGGRIAGSLRPTDTVARFGGDEFAILLDPITDGEDARRVAERIQSELKAPFDLDGRSWFISASMGIAVGDRGRSSPDEVLREAEIALVQAKSDGTLRHALFDPSMGEATLERVDLERDLRVAVERDELRLHYQPIVDLHDGRIVGVEALVRWQHPVRGLVAPAAFIPLAEETGLILPIGRWVLETACAQARVWRDLRPEKPLVMNVNLSARQFAEPGLVEDVTAVLAAAGLAPGALELEITESVAMDDSEAGVRTLRALRELGVRLVLDDFGTGYSSLSYLKHLPLDTIKIDRSFVTELDDEDANVAIVKAVVSLAHGLGIDVVAEGIESLEQATRLSTLGCDLGQGYVWSQPLPAGELDALLARGSVSGGRP